MTMNICIITIVFISACIMGTPPFSVIQLLWMNLVMDVLAAIAICTEPFNPDPRREEENFKLKRISRAENIFTDEMWRNILPMATLQIIIMLVIMYAGNVMFFDEPNYGFNIITTLPRDKKGKATSKLVLNTMCFNTFMVMNIMNMLNCRVNMNELNIFTNLFNNMYFWIVFIFELLVQIAFIYYAKDGLLGILLNTAPQTLAMTITSWVLGFLILPVRTLFTKFLPPEKFKFMLKVDLEKDTSNNCITKCFKNFFKRSDEREDADDQFKPYESLNT